MSVLATIYETKLEILVHNTKTHVLLLAYRYTPIESSRAIGVNISKFSVGPVLSLSLSKKPEIVAPQHRKFLWPP